MDAAFLLNSRAHKINEDNDKGLVSFPLSFLREVLFACVVTHDIWVQFLKPHISETLNNLARNQNRCVIKGVLVVGRICPRRDLLTTSCFGIVEI